MFFIVSTPIGNLGDVSFRAIEILKKSDLIICENFDISRRLFEKYEIPKKKILRFHAKTNEKQLDKIVQEIKLCDTVSQITDAGTPGISDPSYKLLNKILDETDVEVSLIPGATALISAITVSGFPMHRFKFFGFLPHKKGKEKMISEIMLEESTSVFYEAKTRILKTLLKISKIDENRKICIASEITKIYENFFRGTVKESISFLENRKILGEFVIVLASKNF